MIIFNNVYKYYGEKKVIDNLNFELEKGKINSLIGPNGSGKTTIMKVILNLTNYKGSCEVKGDYKNIKNIKIAYVPEIITFYDYLTGYEALNLITELQNNNKELVYENFKKLENEYNYEDGDKLISAHSKGNLRKLLLLQALSSEPELYLLDEPFSGIDSVSIEKLKECLIKERNRGATIFINTHLLDIAKSFCDKLFFLKKGSIKLSKNSTEFYQIDICRIYND